MGEVGDGVICNCVFFLWGRGGGPGLVSREGDGAGSLRGWGCGIDWI